MSRRAAIAALAWLATPCAALALTQPTPGKQDRRVQTAPWKPGEVYALHLVVGRAMTVTVPPNIWVDNALASDTANIQQPQVYGSSVVFKAIAPSPAKPMFVFGHDRDGLPQVVTFEVDVQPPASCDSPTPAKSDIPTSAKGDGQPSAKGDSPPSDPCDGQPFSLTLIDQAAEAAARAAAWRAAQQRREEQTAARALRDPPPPSGLNTDYAARGDRALLGR